MADNKEKTASQKQQHADPATIKCKVHRLNCDPTNAMIPITVNAIGRPGGGRKEFRPGDVVNLSQAQVNNLEDAVDEPEVLIPEGSGVYEKGDPVQAAQAQYPGYRIVKDPATGFITATKRVPHFSIERAPRGGF
jgi:hypothetical protein